jgi:glycosyltransferase involved in cell wall biosynthesis
VLDAAKELKARGNDRVKIALVGQGKLKPNLQARADEEQLDNVIFHEPVNKDKLSGLMRSADIGLQVLANVPAFYYGTSPNKFFDYIASGLPVLNNYPGWLAGMIQDNQCGFSIQPESPKAFADALESALHNKVQLIDMGINSRALAEKEFDRKKLADKWVSWVTGVTKWRDYLT